jgi:hypothetical protein
MPHPEVTAEALRKELELAEAEPDVNPLACIIILIFTVGFMGVTAGFVRLLRRLGPIIIFTSLLRSSSTAYSPSKSHQESEKSTFLISLQASSCSNLISYTPVS